jgi:CRISPR-associated protein Cmr5
MMRTIQQKYAAAVYDKVNAYQGDRDKYGAMALKLPILVRTAGLAQALAFVESRGKQPFNDLLEDLAQVVIGKNAKTFVAESRTNELPDYIYLTKQTLIALDWFKRFAQSIYKVKTTTSAED